MVRDLNTEEYSSRGVLCVLSSVPEHAAYLTRRKEILPKHFVPDLFREHPQGLRRPGERLPLEEVATGGTIKDLPDRVHELSWTHEIKKEVRGWQPVTVAMVGPRYWFGISHPLRRSPGGAFCRSFQALASGQIPEVTYARNGRRRHAGSGPVRG